MLKDKKVVITGGSRGIGKAIALGMAKEGADIAIIYSGNDEAAKETCSEVQSLGREAKSFKCDVANFEDCNKTINEIIAEFGRIDVLVNNAGITRDGLILTLKEKDFDDVINTNLKGAFNMIKPASKNMMRNKKGTIINITSVSGMMGNAGQANYAAAKAGMIGLTKTVAKELAQRGITCNAIAPGFVETQMTDKLSEDVKNAVKDMVPLGRMAKPEDIANMAVFLASEKASYITGEIIKVDGGLYI